MLNIAVYSEDPSGMAMLKKYMTYAQKHMDDPIWVDWYREFDIMIEDMETFLSSEIVIVYRDWNVARIVKQYKNRASLVMVSPAINKELYNIQPCYMLYEPVDAGTFEKVLMMAARDISEKETFSFKIGRTTYRLCIDDIMYFENEKRIVNVVCRDARYSYYGSVRELEHELSRLSSIFVRVHESYIINMEYVAGYAPDHFIMADDFYVRISQGRRINVRDRYTQYTRAARGD